MLVDGLNLTRSLLFAPAVRPDFLAKLPSRGADAVVIDCEDATPANDDAKASARREATTWAEALSAAGQQVTVRINAVPSRWFERDITEALSPHLRAVVVPKVETVDQLSTTAAALDAAGWTGLGILAGIETAAGVYRCVDLAAHERVVGVYFGAEDFIADMGGTRTDSNGEVAYARSHVALAARLGGVPGIDQIVAAHGDQQRFIDECQQARALGFAGKMCIHPSQVELANDGFSPSSSEIERARRLVSAYERACAQGIAAIDFDGQMVDEPLAAQARRVLALADPADLGGDVARR